MKHIAIISLITFLSLSNCGFSQQPLCIKKFREYDNKPKRVQTIYMDSNKVMREINYAYNEWQVYDSIVYRYISDSIIIKASFQPKYDDEKRIIKQYKYYRTDTFQLKHKFNSVTDKYFVMDEYLKLWDFIFDVSHEKPSSKTGRHMVVTNFAPMILVEYGLPHDALLDSCIYTISDLYTKDEFYFQNYYVQRTFFYNKNILEAVIVSVRNYSTQESYDINEKFTYE